MADFQQFKLRHTSEAWLGEIVLPVFLRSGNKAHWRCIFLSSTHGSQLWNLRVYVGVEESHGGFRERDDFEFCGRPFFVFFFDVSIPQKNNSIENNRVFIRNV
jgi:hypothetical protein